MKSPMAEIATISETVAAIPDEDDDLNEAQKRAMVEILAVASPGNKHLLTGWAGSGKTYLVSRLVAKFVAMHRSIVVCAPTHKAVQVIARKLARDGVEVECKTLHSLLSLRPKPQGERQIFVRAPNATPVKAEVVVIDECSMIGADLMMHIRRWLPMAFVLFVGDKAQLPPVGEEASEAFDTKSHSHLDTIVRQAEHNPIIRAASIIRASQGGEMDWSWCAEARHENLGIFLPGREVDAWVRKAFTSGQFRDDPDSFRYLCYRNARVAEINTKIRRWVHGHDPETPFLPGELALIRSPLVVEDTILIATNEEVRVLTIEPSSLMTVGTWAMKVRTEGDMEHDIHVPRDWDGYRIALARLNDAARGDTGSWQEYHDFRQAFISAQAIYALTTHNSQGSTFKFAFVDVSDIRRRARDNSLECQKLLYTAATRPTDGLILVGV